MMLVQKAIEIEKENTITHILKFFEEETGEESDYTMEELYKSIKQR